MAAIPVNPKHSKIADASVRSSKRRRIVMLTKGNLLLFLIVVDLLVTVVRSGDENKAFSPCSDTTVKRLDGFTFGIAFAPRTSFFLNGNVSGTQLSPCDSRLHLSNQASRLSVFRPKVDEISLLTLTPSDSSSDNNGSYMVAFAGRKYAARSPPTFYANGTYTVTNFTLVLEFKKGRLQNFYWKKYGCDKCPKSSNVTCLNKSVCAFKTSSCRNRCNVGIQVAFSGTDKHYSALNSWYEISNLKQYSLYGLYKNIQSSFTNQFF